MMPAIRLTAGLVLLGALVACGRSPRHEQTVGREMEAQKAFFIGQLAAANRHGDAVFLTWAPHNRFDRPSGESEMLVPPVVLTLNDDHGMARYVITRLADGILTVEYESTFHHQSFGKDLVTTDRGSFPVRWQEVNRR